MSRVDADLGNIEHLERFTATGRPFNPNLAQGASSGAQFSGIGITSQIMLPHKFTDNSILTIPVLRSYLEETVVSGDMQARKSRGSWLKKLGGRDVGGKKGDAVMLRMTRG